MSSRGRAWAQRHDYTWYLLSPGGADCSVTEARRMHGGGRIKIQSTGARVISRDGDDPEGLAVWVPHGIHVGPYSDPASYLDPEDGY